MAKRTLGLVTSRPGLNLRPRAPSGGPSRPFQSSSKTSSEALGPAAKLPEAEPLPPAKPHQTITIADIQARRAKAGRLVAPTAAVSHSDMFKAPPSENTPFARRWDHLLSRESAARKPCSLKQAARHLQQPGLLSLGGGLPHPAYFPISSLSMQVPGTTPTTATIGKYDVAETPSAVWDLSIALNYGQAIGGPPLLRWVTEHTEVAGHAPPYRDWRCALTAGSTAALEQALRMLCSGGRGDAMLTDEYSFSTALETAAPLGVRAVGVPVDEQGLLPGEMDEILKGWDQGARGGARKPHVLYTVPSGQNPTGATQGRERRREIYEVCRRHDVYILEDEPYYFLQMQPYKEGVRDARAPAPSSSVEEFLAGLVPSLLSMDVDGRVMRLDSFSKVVVPGARLGWVTASEQMIERFVRHAEVCNQGPSGFSQVLLHKLLDEHWGHEGYLRWLMGLGVEYTKRRNVLLAACEDLLPRDIVSWNPPAAGMFHWLKVDHTLHPEAATRSIEEIEEEIFNLCIEKGVLVARGSWFRAEQDKPATGLYFRTTFAAATPENMREAVGRFGEAVRQVYRLA